jgi:hypothetical protein
VEVESKTIRAVRHDAAVAPLTTRDIAVYAAVVSTGDVLFSVYRNGFLDRPRITVRATESEGVPLIGPDIRDEVLVVTVSNRGRRPVNVKSVMRVKSMFTGVSDMSVEILQQLSANPRIEESDSKTFFHGQQIGSTYRHGDLPTSRWYVTDGADRTHPLRERYRQRIEAIIFWPLRRFLQWRSERRRHE